MDCYYLHLDYWNLKAKSWLFTEIIYLITQTCRSKSINRRQFVWIFFRDSIIWVNIAVFHLLIYRNDIINNSDFPPIAKSVLKVLNLQNELSVLPFFHYVHHKYKITIIKINKKFKNISKNFLNHDYQTCY